MGSDEQRKIVRGIAQEYLAKGEVTGWFEPLYKVAAGESSIIPWADLKPNPNLVEWLDRVKPQARGRALVIGCGLGDDAQELAQRGWRATAFDIAPTAIDWCRRRFPDASVEFRVADLLAPPAEWKDAFDFVLESYTIQAMPGNVRAQAIRNVGQFVAPGGMLLIICRGRDKTEPPGELPWPLVRSELAVLTSECGLVERSFEDYEDVDHDPPARRFRVAYDRRG